MNVPSKYGLLKVAGWVLILLSVVFLGLCIAASVWVSGETAGYNFPGGVNFLALIPIIIGIVSFISWIVKATELFALSDTERNSRVNQQSIERVMRLTEVQVTGGGSSTQPLPTMSDR